ncbi:MAG TPA: TonB-dependent receptor [Rhizomicrobium sp.]|jgi:outer membrane receptor protein involved in Fe transport
MKSARLIGTALAAALWFSPQAKGQSAEPSALTNEQIETVIVTGSRPPLNAIPMQAPFTESTITPEAILNITPSPATTVQTLLNTQPSIYATTGATNGMETDIKFRSFSDGEFGETIAGVPLNDIFNSGVTYQADNRDNVLFITRDLDSVQIYRGVNNPAVNTYNSLGGTINFIPRQPADEIGGDIGVDGGSFNTLDYHATFNTGDLHGIKQTISFERDFSSGWLQNTPDWNDNLYYAGNADIDNNTQVFGYMVYNKNRGDAPQFIPENLINRTFNFQWPGNLYRSINLDTNYLGIAGFKTKILDFITIEDEGYFGDNSYERTSFSNPAYPGPYFIDDQGSGYPFWTSYMGYAGYTQFPYNGKQAYGFPVVPLAQGGCAPICAYAGTDYHFYGYNGALYGDRAKITADLPLNTVTAGGDFNLGELHSREYWYGTYNMPMVIGYNDAWDERDTRQMWSIYAQDDVHLFDDRLHITPGFKYVSAHTKDNDALGFYYSAPGADRADEHFLSPTLGANYQVFPDFDIYGAYGKNVKFPDITAFYNAVAGTNTAPIVVKPEYAQDFEVGARYQWDSLHAELNLYDERFTDIILSATTQSGFTQYQNGGAEQFRGVELQLTDDFGEFWIGSWKGYLNASFNEAVCSTLSKDDLSGTTCEPGQSLPNIPNYLLNVGLIWDYDGWHVDLQGHYVGKQELQDFNTNLPGVIGDIQPGQMTENPDYFLVNVGIIKVIPVQWGPANALRFAFHVDNLFDTHYFSDAQSNTDLDNGINPKTGNQLLDFYGLSGEPRAVFGSVSVYF